VGSTTLHLCLTLWSLWWQTCHLHSCLQHLLQTCMCALPWICLPVLEEQEANREKEREREYKRARNRERQSLFKVVEKHLCSELSSLQPCRHPESCSHGSTASNPLLLPLSLLGSLVSSSSMVPAALPLVLLLHPLPHAHAQAILTPLSPTSLLYFPGMLALLLLAHQASVMSDSGTCYLYPCSMLRSMLSPPLASLHMWAHTKVQVQGRAQAATFAATCTNRIL
jgi:hypothetical protein